MKASEIMKSDVKCISPNDNAKQAAKLMKEANIGFLPVCDSNKKVLGTLTDRDIVIRLLAVDQDLSTQVDKIMSRDVVSISLDDDLERAEELMRDENKSRLIVCDDDGKLAGVISLSDVVDADEDRGARTLRGVSQREVRH